MLEKRKRGRPRKRAGEAPRTKPAEPPVINDSESPLFWLSRRKDKDGDPLISEDQYTAGERLRADFFFAHMTPRTTIDWQKLKTANSNYRGAPDSAADVSIAVSAAQERVRSALKCVGPGLADVLIDVCCHLRGIETCEKSMNWPQRTGKIILRIALQQLAVHYGIVMASESGFNQPRAINRWVTDDFRPKALMSRGDHEDGIA